MTIRLMLAWLHLVALVVGSTAVWSRARALHQAFRDHDTVRAIRRALVAEVWWALAAITLVVTGLWRVLGSTDKSSAYYFANHAFSAKMAMVVAVAALEIWPIATLMRWRNHRFEPTRRAAGLIEAISYVQLILMMAIVFAAVSMARGLGASGGQPAMNAPAASDTLRGLGAEETTGAPATPSGSAVPTPADLALLSQEIAMPISGIDPAKLQSSFNAVRGGGTRRHEALDIMSPRGTPVHAATSGRVLKLFTSKAGGLMVYATDSSERFILMYGHLDGYAPDLHDGARLERGQIIGCVGFTGNASPNAPHLHFAVARSADVKRWSSGTAVDPLPVLQGAGR